MNNYLNNNIEKQSRIDTVNIYPRKENIDIDSERKKYKKNKNEKKNDKFECDQGKTIIIAIVIIVVLIMALLGIFGPWDKIKIINTKTENDYQMTYAQYKDELRFNTKVNDLKRITIIQKSDENIALDGLEIENRYLKITNCDIYIISKKESDELNKSSFNETYTASISISSQCLTKEEDNCEPKKLVDLMNTDNKNLRILEQINDLKDIPVPLCLFDITDTNIITSISCPESLPENIKNDIISYLNYFRPIASSSSNKIDEFNMTVNNGVKYIQRNSQGLCDTDNMNNSNSFCNVDMNITKDSNGNLLLHEETIFVNISSDIKNKLISNITTKLTDETSKIKSLNPDNYKKILNDFLSKLNPYLKYEEKYSMKVSNKKKLKINRANFNTIRKLQNENNNTNDKEHLVKEEYIFFREQYTAEISLKLKIDADINSESMKTFLNLKLGNKNNELVGKFYYSSLNRIIKKLKSLSKTGNYLASLFYEKINESFNKLTKEITIRINNLNSLIVYKDLTAIFDSSLTLGSIKILPYDILENSKNLFNKINFIFSEILDEKGDFKNYTNFLKNNINDYLEESNNTMANVFNNLDKLKDLLKSPKNIYTEISTYYSNNTPTSYVNTIQKAENIYLNYDLKKDLNVNKTMENILNNFEQNYFEKISKQYNLSNYLYLGLKNKSITVENTTNEEYEIIMKNLYNSNNYTNLIADEIKNEIKKIISDKIEEYAISNNEKEKYRNIAKETLETGSKLDNDEFFDKLSDEIMIKFKENFTKILLNMDRIKEEKFPLIDEPLKEGLFSESTKRDIKTKIKEGGVYIINKIKNEHNIYMNSIKEYLDQFLSENLENLNSLIYDLSILLSGESLSEISYWYDVAYYKSTSAITYEIQYIDTLIKKYYSAFNNLTLEVALSKVEGSSELTLLSHEKKINKTYFDNYRIFKINLENLKNYVNNNLYDDLLYEYKNIFLKIKEILQAIKSNKLSDVYPDINKLSFNDIHINCIDDLNNQINKYLSLDIFNNDYSPLLIDFKANKIKEIDNIINFVDEQHSILSKLKTIEDNNGEDSFYACIEMKFNKKYTEASYCINYFYEQYIKITDYSIYTDDVNKNIGNFNNITSNVTKKANSYIDKINLLKQRISSIEAETLNQNITNDYLSPIINQTELILLQQYGEGLIKSSYNYYKNNLYGKIDNIFNVINNSFIEIFNSLEEQLNNNVPKFKYSTLRFSSYSIIYKDIILLNLTYNYFNSIENLQKNEFNYTISYYYNYLLKIVNSTYYYVINNIPINDMNLNIFFDLRKKEVDDIFNELIKKIIDSKNAALNITNQINILNNEESNFFNIDSILDKHINKTDNYLENKIEEINKLDNGMLLDEYSYAINLYFENSDFSKQINAFYNQIYDKLFIDLNQDKFKELMNNNFNFDVDQIIKQIHVLLFDSNKEIYNEFSVVKEYYTKMLEEEINKYFTKEGIIEKINNLYKSEINLIDKNNFTLLNKYISTILNKVKSYITSESNRLNTTAVSYNNDFSVINNTLKQYKENLYNEIISIIYNIIDEFRNNLINKVYNNYIEPGLNSFITEAKKYTNSFKEYKLLNSTFNLGEIVNDIIKDLTNDYKEIVKRQIDYGVELRLTRLKTNINTDSLKNFINDGIESKYNSTLLIVLKKVATYDSGITGYPPYDFDNTKKTEIDNNFKTNINNIKNVLSSGIKGNNYQANIDEWETLNFIEIKSKLAKIEKHFENFISSEENHENTYISESIQKIIKLNFNKSLNDLISSFGNDFFEREEKYNEYFRVIDLYNDLKTTILQTYLFYKTLSDGQNSTLPIELKAKICDMNNIESLINENKDYIMKSVNTNIEMFITDVKDSLLKYYLSYLENEAMIALNFDDSIVKMINNNLNIVKNDIEATYFDSLNSNLNKKFISIYNETLNKETENIMDLINRIKEDQFSEVGNLFTLEQENILEEINDNINKTLKSIFEYDSLSFSPPDELIDFFNNFTEEKIKPIYDEFKDNIDKFSNNLVISHFKNSTKNYEASFNLDKIMNYSEESSSVFRDKYIDNISLYLNHYQVDYPDIYEEEISKEKEYVINYKPLEDTLQKLLTNFENTKIYIETLKEFNDYDKIMKNNINNLNIAYKESKRLIKVSNFEEDIDNDFNNKLDELKETSLNYYNKINGIYYNISQYLNKSIENIDDILNKCINTIYDNLKDQYKKIADEEDPIDEEDTKVEEELNEISNNFKIEKTRYFISANIKNLLHYTRFKYNLEFENNDYRKLKLIVSIINKSRPKIMETDIFSFIGHCGKKGFLITTNINDVNYQMNLNYDTKSNNITYFTNANFDKYEYNIEQYELEDSYDNICITLDYINFCFPSGICENRTSLFNEKYFNEQKIITETN